MSLRDQRNGKLLVGAKEVRMLSLIVRLIPTFLATLFVNWKLGVAPDGFGILCSLFLWVAGVQLTGSIAFADFDEDDERLERATYGHAGFAITGSALAGVVSFLLPHSIGAVVSPGLVIELLAYASIQLAINNSRVHSRASALDRLKRILPTNVWTEVFPLQKAGRHNAALKMLESQALHDRVESQ